MEELFINKNIAQLILLQRIELSSPFLKKIRKLSGRYFFTNFASKYFISSKKIGKKYMDTMEDEFHALSKYLDFNKGNILSIGGGMCGLELIIGSKFKNSSLSIIERNFTSKKVIYGWDPENREAYNNLSLLKLFLSKNGLNQNRFFIYDFDQDKLPDEKFDYVISLYSLDYHYDFKLYEPYLRKIMQKNTQIIFDTIRPDYFKDIFKNVVVINEMQNSTHKSIRLICNDLK